MTYAEEVDNNCVVTCKCGGWLFVSVSDDLTAAAIGRQVAKAVAAGNKVEFLPTEEARHRLAKGCDCPRPKRKAASR